MSTEEEKVEPESQPQTSTDKSPISDNGEEKTESLANEISYSDEDEDSDSDGSVKSAEPDLRSAVQEKINNRNRSGRNREANLQIANAHPNLSRKSSHDKNDPSNNLFQRSATTPNMLNQTNEFGVIVSWRNLVYTVQRKQLSLTNCFTKQDGRSVLKRRKRTVLKGICGYFRTGSLTAVMGPSGSGKSTMLECIAGFRKTGLSGEVKISSGQKNDNIKVALISQTDYLIESFTVREMLVYASRLKNHAHLIAEESPLEEVVTTISNSVDTNINGVDSSSKKTLINKKNEKEENYHEKLASNVLQKLGLDVCADTRAASCSGGQKKRISIAVEMISKPNILILDEPTSGLDSSACFQTVSVMQSLTKDLQYPIGVVATIHQPSSRVFNLFDHVYVISYNGHCIYQGSPQNMLAHLASVELSCPQFHNPADFIAEVAACEHGSEVVDRLIEVKEREDLELPDIVGSTKTLAQYSDSFSHPTFLHIWILIQRTTLHIMRDPMLNTLRLMSHIMTALFLGVLYGTSIGKPSLCPPVESPLNDLENFASYRIQYQNDVVTSTENLAYIFFTLMFIMFGAMMPTIMTFPTNLFILRKEKINGWYSVATYYLALSISEIPFQFIYPASFVSISYYMTGQLLSVERIMLFFFICVLMAFISQSQGLLIGALFMSDASAAVFLGPISTVPMMLFAGFFVRIKTIPSYLKFISYISYLRYAFETMIIIIYGLDRCSLDPDMLKINGTNKPEWMGLATMVLGEGGEKFIDSFARSLGGTYDPMLDKKYQSTILEQFDVNEDDFFFNIAILVTFFLVMRLLTYIILIIKINKRD